MHENRLEVHTYTINSNEDKTFVKSLKVDGYFTNYPD
ncbi:glycerophosphodiester phosphodiesterase family protein [Macrococcus armenti]|nr:hypothetical protein LAU44_03925 [Macrococcus armenti]UBH18468.1 hypothetical protein LAU39_03935 [Macrococcus armenti]UBH20735.1 hypothetical protein LAU40_03925 [Macrococcus armenti]